jgi:hypothetical protein
MKSHKIDYVQVLKELSEFTEFASKAQILEKFPDSQINQYVLDSMYRKRFVDKIRRNSVGAYKINENGLNKLKQATQTPKAPIISCLMQDTGSN